MIHVILRKGTVLTYNEATRWDVADGWLAVSRETAGTKYLHAGFPIEIVERVEMNPPCRRRREREPDKRTKFNRGY